MKNFKIEMQAANLSKFLKSVFAIPVILLMIGCGGGGDEDTSNAVVAASATPVAVTTTITPTNPDLPDVIVNTDLDLNKDLATANVTDIVETTIEGRLPSDTKAMWSGDVLLTTGAKEFYVAPDGLPLNAGTKESPWDLYTVSKGDHNIPGDSIVWMEAGEYKHPLSSSTEIENFTIMISGEANKPIHFRPDPSSFTNEKPSVKVDAGIRIEGDWIWLWEVEMTWVEQTNEPMMFDFDGNRAADWRPHNTSPLNYFNVDTAMGFGPLEDVATVRHDVGAWAGSNSKMINVIGNKLFEGISIWGVVENFELHGSIFYDNGWPDLNGPHGHGMYMQNSSGTNRLITDNIVAGNWGHGAQIYVSSSYLTTHTNDFEFVGNSWFATRKDGKSVASIMMGYEVSKNIKFSENFVHGMALEMPYLASSSYVPKEDHECKNNHFYRVVGAKDCDLVTENSNVSRYSDFGNMNPESILRPNKYDSRRANLMVFNPTREDVLSVDLSTFAKNGDKIAIFNPFNMNEPLEYGTYNGYVNLHWPTPSWELSVYTATSEQDIHKEFWTFVVMNYGQ